MYGDVRIVIGTKNAHRYGSQFAARLTLVHSLAFSFTAFRVSYQIQMKRLWWDDAVVIASQAANTFLAIVLWFPDLIGRSQLGDWQGLGRINHLLQHPKCSSQHKASQSTYGSSNTPVLCAVVCLSFILPLKSRRIDS